MAKHKVYLKRGRRVFVALSGGVDSSVAAALLKERGFNVFGIHMKLWSPRDSSQQPTASNQHHAVCQQQYQDRLDAMRVAAKLDIPFQTWDFAAEYRRAVVEYMIRGYAAGRTPNPDVMCNSRIKFGVFLERALEAGADYIATGHYIWLRGHTGTPQVILSGSEGSPRDSSASPQNDDKVHHTLLTAKDPNKDQSYFLWTLTQKQLQHCLFPIGQYTKLEVREMARRYNLPTAEKPDSQGICFIGEVDVRGFLKNYIPERKGLVLTAAGRAVGEHNGTEFYTIGQRQGLGIGGGIPYYVTEKDTKANTLVVAEGPYEAALFRRELIAADVNWISGKEPRWPLKCEARIRYRQPLQACSVKRIGDRVQVVFRDPQRAVTPGQSVVFYQKDELLGGGVIV